MALFIVYQWPVRRDIDGAVYHPPAQWWHVSQGKKGADCDHGSVGEQRDAVTILASNSPSSQPGRASESTVGDIRRRQALDGPMAGEDPVAVVPVCGVASGRVAGPETEWRLRRLCLGRWCPNPVCCGGMPCASDAVNPLPLPPPPPLFAIVAELLIY